jgi:hypothetical protein
MQSQKGYLLFAAVLLIMLVSVIISASYMFVSSAQSTTDSAQAQKALYIAVSGLEVANRYLLKKNIPCENITGNADLTNENFGGGQYQVEGIASHNNTTLTTSINTTDATIPLASTIGFPSSGTISIDDEMIFYPSISGNSLTSVSRGIANTDPATHANSAKVNQSQCALTSTAGYPSLLLALGKRTLQRIYIGRYFQIPISVGNYRNAAVISANNITINNNGTIINPNVSATSPNFNGSTMISRGTATLNLNGATKVNSSSGLVISSSKGNFKTDIVQNNTLITSSNLFNNFFNQSKATVQAAANQTYNANNINGANNVTIWINGNLTLNGATTVGTPDKPVILIVNGTLNLNNSATIYGFVYATGNVALNKSNLIVGALVSERNITLNYTSTVQYDLNVLSGVNEINNSLTTTYVQTPGMTMEIFA